MFEKDQASLLNGEGMAWTKGECRNARMVVKMTCNYKSAMMSTTLVTGEFSVNVR